ncbi:MAG: alcohol dehydrogenase catalytic domain-containing protein [Planctomycetia bacterium]|nr:alcohol dehydrogenase catalytic domain-containing protein [Planctomycetia bacterium]
MIAARYTQGGGFAVTDAPEPVAEPGGLVVRIDAASICGTDIKILNHGHRKLRDGQTITLGHEFVGTIVEVNGSSNGFAVGQQVGVAPNIGCGHCGMCMQGMGNMCPAYSAFGIDRDGAHAPLVAIPRAAIEQALVIPLPDGADPRAATLAEPLSCVVAAQRATRIEPGDTVVIYGAGPMGLLHVMLAATSGAGRIIVADRNPARLALARELGAADTVNVSEQSVRDWAREHAPGGVDVVIIAVPVPEIQTEALEILAPLGRLCLFAGWPRGTTGVPLDTNAVHYKSLLVTGTTGGAPRDYVASLKLIGSGRVDVRRVVSHVYSFADLAKAYDTAASGTALKVVIAAQP